MLGVAMTAEQSSLAAHLLPGDPKGDRRSRDHGRRRSLAGFFRICLPIVSPGILTVSVISGLNTWNEFLISSTFLQSHDAQTAIVRFYTLGGQYTSDWGEIMAAAILIVAPAVVFFLIMQRSFIEGMASGSVKG